ncbi:hypothetical protein IWW39_004824 [Coemansia spiralis]|uniref:Uncharacterized protein n=1 Tax=Coemansia spiralis TaxID=417178 RepID=A0A9W8GFP8_9FUNG|nr:hypothetical protein IWW39_004824 [Coemansia spiralis]
MQVSNEHTEPMISFGEPLHVSVERGIKLFNSIQRSYSNPLPIDDDDNDDNKEEAITGNNNASNQNSATIVAPFCKLGKAAMHGFGIGHLFGGQR